MKDLGTTSMNDLGEVMDYPRMTTCGCDDCKKNKDKKKEEVKKHYPRESFTTEQLPGLKGLDLGSKVKIVLEAEVVAVRAGDEYGYDEDSKKAKQTKVTLKLLSGTTKKMDTKTDAPTKEEKSSTYEQKQKKEVENFSAMLEEEDED